MREIVAEISREIIAGASINDIEDYCRFVISQEIEDQDMVFTEEQIEDIIDPIVRDESMVDAEAIEDGEIITDYDWDNLEDAEKATDKSGNKFVVTSGTIKPVTVIKNEETSRIAQRIFEDIQHGYEIYKLKNSGQAYDFYTLFKKSDKEVHCTFCNSTDVDPVWTDDEEEFYFCHDCGDSFSVPATEAEVSIETATEEEYVLVDEPDNYISGIIYLDSETGDYMCEIMRNGELVSINVCEDPDEQFALMEQFAEYYEDVEEGEILRSTETGNEMTVESVNGDIVMINGKQASRANLVISKIKGSLLSDKSNILKVSINAGDSFRNAFGDTLKVGSKQADGTYLFSELYTDRVACATREYEARGTKDELVKILKDSGYIA